MWIFGYGSLIFRPSFPFAERRDAWLTGFARRLWQASPDHRGVPDAPGRVVTLVRAPTARTWGVAYRIAVADVDGVLAHLDQREQNGYERHAVALETRSGSIDATLWLAGPGNPSYRGDEPDEAIAAVVRSAVGPSGSNREYVERLVAALRAAGERDPHVEAVHALVGAPSGGRARPEE